MNALTRTATAYWRSSIGKKLVVAITGLFLVLFLAGHLSGNLLIFAGQKAFNDYAQFLHEAGHGMLVWVARIGLLALLVLHVWATVLLTKQNRAARKPYEFQATIQASRSSRLMIVSGLTILAFVIFHILHFTVRAGTDYGTYVDAAYLAETGDERHDAYRMVLVGFKNFWVVLFYVIAMTLLCSHLSHGVASIFQTLGLRSKKARDLIFKLSWAYSLLIWAGFISIPLGILFGIVSFKS